MKLTAILVMVMVTAAFAQTQPANAPAAAPAGQNQPAASRTAQNRLLLPGNTRCKRRHSRNTRLTTPPMGR